MRPHTSEATRALKAVLRTAVREAVKAADEHGITRGEIAKQLGIAPNTLDSWKNETTDADTPVLQLVALLRRDILPQAAKVTLVNALLRDTGIEAVIADADYEDTGTPLQQLADITIAAGNLAEKIQRASRRDSDGGERMTGEEIKRALGACNELGTQQAELKRLLEHMAEN